MRTAVLLLAVASLLCPAFSQDSNDGPADEKAQKTYKNAFEELKERLELAALDDFKKAD